MYRRVSKTFKLGQYVHSCQSEIDLLNETLMVVKVL